MGRRVGVGAIVAVGSRGIDVAVGIGVAVEVGVGVDVGVFVGMPVGVGGDVGVFVGVSVGVGVFVGVPVGVAVWVGVLVGVNIYNVTSEQLQKAEIARTFGRYVSPPVAAKILGAVDEGSLKLGGEECTVTVLFADVRNFSGFSEYI